MRVRIVGAGPAGCLTAIALHRLGIEVEHVARPIDRRPDYAEIVPAAFVAALAELGLIDRWQAWSEPELCPGFTTRWSPRRTTNPLDGLRPVTGHLVHRRRLEQFLREMAASLGIVARQRPSAAADWTIDATGRAASIARRQGAMSVEISRLNGVTGSSPRASRQVVIEPIDDGWLFAAPDRGATSLAYFSDAAAGDRRSPLDRLAAATAASHSLAAFAPVEAHDVLATSRFTDPVVGENWIAVGDAALTKDPLSGTGLAFAADTALEAARVVTGDCSTRDYAKSIERGVARYRIDRHRHYTCLGPPRSKFWDRQAALALS